MGLLRKMATGMFPNYFSQSCYYFHVIRYVTYTVAYIGFNDYCCLMVFIFLLVFYFIYVLCLHSIYRNILRILICVYNCVLLAVGHLQVNYIFRAFVLLPY